MSEREKPEKVVWRFSDGRAGHDAQSRGLIAALAGLVVCEWHELPATAPLSSLGWGLLKKFPGAHSLPDPDLLVGAGHACHVPMLMARRARGGRAIVLMKPTLPTRLFDLCIIPEHDRCPHAENILRSKGPLNSLHAGKDRSPDHGLILVGGHSRHFDWATTSLLEQISQVLTRSAGHWTIADSARTPDSTRVRLQKLCRDTVHYMPWAQPQGHGLVDLMQRAGTIWVSEDSMSMIFEALSTGAAVGVLQIPRRGKSRLAGVATTLAAEKYLTLFDDWHRGQALAPPVAVLAEAQRCAHIVCDRFRWQAGSTA